MGGYERKKNRTGLLASGTTPMITDYNFHVEDGIAGGWERAEGEGTEQREGRAAGWPEQNIHGFFHKTAKVGGAWFSRSKARLLQGFHQKTWTKKGGNMNRVTGRQGVETNWGGVF